MNKFPVSKKTHFICNHLILSMMSCFGMKDSWWGCFNGVYLLFELCSAENVDDLLDDITGLVGIWLLPDLDDSTEDVSYESSGDEDSDNIIIVFAIRTHYFFLISSLWRNVLSNSSLALVIDFITLVTRGMLIFPGWNRRAKEQ